MSEFQQNPATIRFIKCLNTLMSENKVRSHRKFAESVNYLPQSISEITKGRRDVPIEVVIKAMEVYGLSANYIMAGEGTPYKDQMPDELRVLTIVTNDIGNERIVHVPQAAQAGYLHEQLDPVYMRNLPTFTLPGYQYDSQTYRCFEVSGDSMEPTLFDGEQIVCGYVEPGRWAVSLRDQHVYVVVTKGDVLVKRIRLHNRERRLLELVSDNSFYPPQTCSFDDIREFWIVKTKISPFLHSPPRNDESHQITMQRIEEQQKQILVLTEMLTRRNG
jgi:Peptidase S24-like